MGYQTRSAAGMAAVCAVLVGAPAWATTTYTSAVRVDYFAHFIPNGQLQYLSNEIYGSATGAASEATIDTGKVRVPIPTGGTVPESIEVRLPGSMVWAKADQGVLKAKSQFGLYMTQNYPFTLNGDMRAEAAFADTLTINAGNPGQRGTAVFRLLLDGTFANRLSETLPASIATAVYVQSYFAINQDYYFPIDGSAASVGATARAYEYRVNYISGTPVPIRISLMTGVFVATNGPSCCFNGTYAYASSDFSHTLVWGGLSSVTPAGGGTFTGPVSITSASGANYSQSFAVPEPSTWALLIAGFGIVGVAARRSGRTAVRST